MRKMGCAVAVRGGVLLMLLHAWQLLSEQSGMQTVWSSEAVRSLESVISTHRQMDTGFAMCLQRQQKQSILWPAAGKAIKGKRDRYIIATKFASVIRDGEHSSQPAHCTVCGHGLMLPQPAVQPAPTQVYRIRLGLAPCQPMP